MALLLSLISSRIMVQQIYQENIYKHCPALQNVRVNHLEDSPISSQTRKSMEKNQTSILNSLLIQNDTPDSNLMRE